MEEKSEEEAYTKLNIWATHISDEARTIDSSDDDEIGNSGGDEDQMLGRVGKRRKIRS
jgi:hypothetical protein